MKRVQIVALLLVTALLSACAVTAPRYMTFKEDPAVNIFALKPEPGMAALVVVRTTSFGGFIEFDTYLDRKMIGVTQWKSYFFKTDIMPGIHYVISRGETWESIRMKFEPDHVYYVQHIAEMGMLRARVRIVPVGPGELSSTFDSSCRQLVYDSKNPGENLSDEDYNAAVQYYEDHLPYRGY